MFFIFISILLRLIGRAENNALGAYAELWKVGRPDTGPERVGTVMANVL